MATKNISTRMQICGRSPNCHGGHSAIGQSSYIQRETMKSEYDGLTYYPKYSEDLVHAEVILCKNAPSAFSDPSKLWNSVEMAEKSVNAQLARTFRVSLPNEWSYKLAIDVVRDYIDRNFVSQGMCVQFAIHDSENKKTGQRNLHCHMMMTLRSIDENGKWMPKQKKIYLTDENGDRIPLIDKKTGLQKVDKQNRKQWKCATVSTNDWSDSKHARAWRKDLVDTINSINEKLGTTEHHWEHRSFKEQGLDIIPQIHLGEKASALERAGIPSIRGNINREIIEQNRIILQAKEALHKAEETLRAALALSGEAVTSIKNEIMEMIQKIAQRNHERLHLPIMGTTYVHYISNRQELQKRSYMENFVSNHHLNSFSDMQKLKSETEPVYMEKNGKRRELSSRISYLENLLSMYEIYEPYIKYNNERFALKGFARKIYEQRHYMELLSYDVYRKEIKSFIVEEDKSITAKAWKKELASLKPELEKVDFEYAKSLTTLASIEVLEHNKKEFSKMLIEPKSIRERLSEIETRSSQKTIIKKKELER